MRNMSFALTTAQVRNQTKTVTRRLGWKNLQPGTLIQPVVKGMGLKKGEKAEKVGGPIRVISVEREPLRELHDYNTWNEVTREGFPQFCTEEFIDMFCASHRGCTVDTEVTRIEFEYTEEPPA